MGNQNLKKIIILDAQDQGSSAYSQIVKKKQFRVIIYKTLEEFIEKENPKQIRNLIVRYVNHVTNDMEGTFKNIQYRKNSFEEVCPAIKRRTQSLKDEIVKYIKKYNLALSIFLFTDNTSNIKLLQHEKPYIKLISDNLEYIFDFLSQPESISSNSSLSDTLFQGLYRRIMVKIIEPRFNDANSPPDIQADKELMKDNKIAYQFFKDIEDFQKSNISTNCEYVVCYPEHLLGLIDSKHICQQDYKILLKTEKNQEQIKINKKFIKSVWGFGKNIGDFIEKMKACTNINSQQTPKIASNIILCGNDSIFLNNFEYIQKTIQQQLPKKRKFKKNMSIAFLKGAEASQFISALRKDIYSFVVVFTEDEYLQKIKKLIRINNFHQRVQLTSINEPKNNENVLEYKISYLLNQIKYLIKFEVCPMYNIHLYKPTSNLIKFFQQKIGIQAQEIRGISDFKQHYVAPNYSQIIESRHLVCNVNCYIEDILPLLKNEEKDKMFKQLKIIVIDNQKNIKFLISGQQYFDQSLVFVDYDLQRIEQYIKFTKVSSVSIPFFRKGVLSDFQKQYRNISATKHTNQVKVKSEVISANQILKHVFKNQIRFSTQYNLQFMLFSATRRDIQTEISYFQNEYLNSYMRLWYIGYDIFEKNRTKQYMYLNIIKQQICYCFYKCKSYGLLKVNEQDFQQFYIDQINMCNNFFDLQVACIYVLSMPHGFNDIISQVLKHPRKSKLAIKIFVTYIVIFITSFYQFGVKELGSLELIAKINDAELTPKISQIKIRDTIFTNNFIFCSAKDITDSDSDYHSIVFSFQNLQFLQKSRLKNFLYIEKYAFYREGAQYIIPPYTKFQVTSVSKNQKGKLQIKLSNATRSQNNFAKRLIKQNGISEQDIWANLNSQIVKMKNNPKINLDINDSTFLYRRTQKILQAQTKQDSISQFGKGQHYDLFFRAKNQKRYVTAFMHLEAKKRELSEALQKTENSTGHAKHELKMLGIQQGFLYFNMGQYVQSLTQLKDVQNYLKQQNVNNMNDEKLQAIRKFIDSVETTYQNRRKVVLTSPKRKYWKVTIQQGLILNASQVKFKLRSHSQSWQVKYDPVQQKFPIIYKGQQLQNNPIHKTIKCQYIVPLLPSHQFGKYSVVNAESQLFGYPFGVITKNIVDKKQQKKIQRLNSMIQLNDIPVLKKTNSQFQSILSVINGKNKYPSKEKENKIEKQIQSRKQKEKSLLKQPDTTKIIKEQAHEQVLQQQKQQLSPFKKFDSKSWSVFYLDNKVQVAPKKKHFHMKPHAKIQKKNKPIEEAPLFALE